MSLKTGLSPDQIWERMRWSRKSLTTSRQAFLSAAVAAYKSVYVFGFILTGDGTSSKTVTIEKLAADGTTYSTIFNAVPVGPAESKQLPPQGQLDPTKPFLKLEGSTNCTVIGSATGPDIVMLYWLDEDG